MTIAGWIHRRRLLKSVAFLIVRDAGGLAQVVITGAELRAEIEAMTEETVVEVSSTVMASQSAPAGVEVIDPTVRVLSEAEPPPFDLYRPNLTATLPTVLDHAALSLRHPRRQAAFRMSAAAVGGFRSTLDEVGYVEIHTPKSSQLHDSCWVFAGKPSNSTVVAMILAERGAILARSGGWGGGVPGGGAPRGPSPVGGVRWLGK